MKPPEPEGVAPPDQPVFSEPWQAQAFALTVALQKGLVKDPTFRDWLWQIPDDRGGRSHRVDVLSPLVVADDVLCSE